MGPLTFMAIHGLKPWGWSLLPLTGRNAGLLPLRRDSLFFRELNTSSKQCQKPYTCIYIYIYITNYMHIICIYIYVYMCVYGRRFMSMPIPYYIILSDDPVSAFLIYRYKMSDQTLPPNFPPVRCAPSAAVTIRNVPLPRGPTFKAPQDTAWGGFERAAGVSTVGRVAVSRGQAGNKQEPRG